jgi:PEP-CTERM motif
MKFVNTCGFAFVALCMTSQTHAATVLMNDPLVFASGVPIAITAGPSAPAPNVPVGALVGSLTNAPGYSFLSSSNPLMAGVGFTFCVDLYQALVVGSPDNDYSIINPGISSTSWGANSAAISGQVDKLMALALPAINAAPTSATLNNALGALQLSLWEVIYDYSPTYSYSLGGGSFQATAGAAVSAQAGAWLAAATLSAAVPTAHYFVAHDPSHQDVLAITAVPEPATVALMVLGLAAVGGVAQRRRAQA